MISMNKRQSDISTKMSTERDPPYVPGKHCDTDVAIQEYTGLGPARYTAKNDHIVHDDRNKKERE